VDYEGTTTLDEHREILEAVMQGDEEEAVRLMETHIMPSSELIEDADDSVFNDEDTD